mgnify:CR=1 FL=1
MKKARRRAFFMAGLEHRVVAEQVGMHRPARQGGIGGAGGHMVLVGQLGPQQCGLRSVNVGQHHRHRLVPPGQPAQVGLVAVKVAARQVHAGQHGAHAVSYTHLTLPTICSV